MKDIQEEIDLQSRVNDTMAEFREIHQEMETAEKKAGETGGKTASAGERWQRIAETETTEAR